MPVNPSPSKPAAVGWEGTDTIGLAAFFFVIVALVVLAATPAVLLQRISQETRDITTIVLPLDEGVRNLALAMEERITSSRSSFLTGDPVYSRRLDQARLSEAEALREIELLAPYLGATAIARVDSLHGLIARRESLEAMLLTGDEQREMYLNALPRFDSLHDSMLVQLRGLNRELVGLTEARVSDQARLARLQRSISSALGVLAVLAALLVGWFAWRQRNLRREIQRALDDANQQRALAERQGEELQRAAEARARLLRGVTHDVKNPLGAARGYAELLQMEVKAPLLPEQAPYLKGIQRSVDGALAIINDLLDLARADSGGLSMARVETDLCQVVAAAVNDQSAAAQAAGHTLELEAPADVEVFTDPARVGQILGNLLSNAIKYTPAPGVITVRSAVEPGMEGGHWATVRVSDTGPGIPPEHREAVFDEFTRLEDMGSQQGHGLGLSIARRVARLLGGDITIEDAASGGASFVLWLPLRESSATPRPGAPETGGQIGAVPHRPVNYPDALTQEPPYTGKAEEPMSDPDSQDNATTGTVEWFDAQRGVGEIRPDNGTAPCGVLSDTLKACGIASLSAGDRVRFRISDASGQRTATDLAMMRAIHRWEGEGGAIRPDGP